MREPHWHVLVQLEDTRMSGKDIDLTDLLGPEPVDPDAPAPEVLVDEAPAPKSRAMGSPSRALLERSRSYPVNRLAKRNTLERLRRILSYAEDNPVGASVALRSGISYSTLKYWLQKSLEGKPGDGFDIPQGEDDEGENEDNTIRFHVAWDLAFEAGVGKVEAAVMKRAQGYLEPLTYQGRIKYRLDPRKMAIARLMDEPEDSPECYLLDKWGAPIPESVERMDPDLAMRVLEAHKPKVYGKKASLDVSVKGGVLVIPMRAQSSEDLNVIEEEYRESEKPLVLFEDDDEDAEA